MAPGYVCAQRAEWLCRYHDTMLPNAAHVCGKGDEVLSCLGKICASTAEDGVHLAQILDDPGQINLLFPARYTSPRGPYGVFGACRFT